MAAPWSHRAPKTALCVVTDGAESGDWRIAEMESPSYLGGVVAPDTNPRLQMVQYIG
jgi:hypothetical protein